MSYISNTRYIKLLRDKSHTQQAHMKHDINTKTNETCIKYNKFSKNMKITHNKHLKPNTWHTQDILLTIYIYKIINTWLYVQL